MLTGRKRQRVGLAKLQPSATLKIQVLRKLPERVGIREMASGKRADGTNTGVLSRTT